MDPCRKEVFGRPSDGFSFFFNGNIAMKSILFLSKSVIDGGDVDSFLTQSVTKRNVFMLQARPPTKSPTVCKQD